MATAPTHDLASYSRQLGEAARTAARRLACLSGQQKNDWLHESARQLREQGDLILAANQQDLDNAPGFGLTEAQTDRLRLDRPRIEGIARGLEQVAALPDPVGETIEASVRPNGLEISKVRVPLGVVFFVYESRPNVTADAAAICVKSGNAVILRGGKEAAHSSRTIIDIVNRMGQSIGLPAHAVQLVDTPDRAVVGHLLKLSEYIDVAIPRGGEGLIRRVAQEATMPVIKHFTGNCHVYVDQHADLEQAVKIVVNSKCQRMGVCNACESLLVHQRVADHFLPPVAGQLERHGIELRGDPATCSILPGAKSATDEDYFAEYLGPILSVRVVTDIDEAISHINHYGSHHTDAIVTESLPAARKFTAEVDSAAVIVNASTRFHDGGEFGLGAEIGISTDKFHARGPCGLRELTTYKYIVYGAGQVR
jgi:glutamate-5-semialdehyde dehydrogenase